jgi:hypothetical protein
MWLYKGKELKDSDIPEKAIGFLYLITNLDNGKWYIGRKLLTMAATKTVAGKKKKLRKDSGWRNYWSSSPELTALVEEVGEDKFKREVLVWCYGKAEMSYGEEKLLYALGALETDQCYNSNIRSKQYRKWVNNYKHLDELNSVISDYS